MDESSAPAPGAHVLHINDAQWAVTPGYHDAAESVLYRSPDGRRVAAAFRHRGHLDFTYPFDEFLVCIRGTATYHLEDGHSFTLRPGSVAYFVAGTSVSMEMSDDFEDVVCLIGDTEIRW